jgi:hypothetical protein
MAWHVILGNAELEAKQVLAKKTIYWANPSSIPGQIPAQANMQIRAFFIISGTYLKETSHQVSKAKITAKTEILAHLIQFATITSAGSKA